LDQSEEDQRAFLRRRQPGEVERGAPQQRRAVGLRIGRQTLLRQGRGDEPVDGVAARRDRGCGRLARQLEGPVALVLGAFGDPAAHRLDLRGREDLVELRRRHVVVRVRREQPLHDRTPVGLARHNRGFARLAALARGLERVEAQLALVLALVGAVAGEAGVGEDRPDIPVELDAFGGGQREGGQRGEGEQTETGRRHGGKG